MRSFLSVVGVVTMLILSSCAAPRASTIGVLYSNGKSGLIATSNPSGTREGEACISSYLGLVAFGDASIETARRNGGITLITSVDESSTGVLGFIYNKYCTIVRGK